MPIRTARHVWRLTGVDPLAFLEATTTQAHLGQQPGETRWCCVLDAHGHVLAFLRSIPLDDATVLLDGEPVCEPGIAWLSSIAFLSKCTIAEAEFGIVSCDAEEEPPVPNVAVSSRADGLEGTDIVVERALVESCPSPTAEHEQARIASGWPRFGIDVTSDSILNDTPLLELCTSFTKGCYRGQETVAKIHNLGHARRGYARVFLSAPAAVSAGAPVLIADQEIGRITSAAEHDTRPVAFAIVRREHVASDEAVVSGTPARLEPVRIAGEPPKPATPPAPLRRSRAFGRR